ncbi:MAG: hypothetical protein ABIB65_01550 [Candidatus Margulisiibacteriota bacterium]
MGLPPINNKPVTPKDGSDSVSNLKKQLLSVLLEAKKKKITTPFPQDKGFPQKVIEALKKGMIKVSISREEPGNKLARYLPLKNTLEVFAKKFKDLKKTSAEERAILLHECYHAYQDITKTGSQNGAENEAPAYFIQLRYWLLAKGFRSASKAAENAVLQYGFHFLYYGPDAMRNLVKAVLSSDPALWKAALEEQKKIYFNAILSSLVMGQLLRNYPSGVPESGASLQLNTPTGGLVLYNLSAQEGNDLLMLYREKEKKGLSLDEQHLNNLSFIDYWLGMNINNDTVFLQSFNFISDIYAR